MSGELGTLEILRMTCASVNNAVAGKIKKDGLAMF